MLTLRLSMSSFKGVNPEASHTLRRKHNMKFVVSILLLCFYTKSVTYRGKDAGKIFLYKIIAEEKRILKLMKTDKSIIFTGRMRRQDYLK